jgi:3-deoxy-D-manno-octulosonic-acid transferase
MLGLYNTALLPLRVAVGLWSRRPLAAPAKREEWAERGARRLATLAPGGVWIHGASVGEARITRDLAAALRARRPGLPLAVSAVTTSGRAQLPGPPAVDAAFYAPLDFRGLPARVLGALRPRLLALVETELWPNLLGEARAGGVRTALVNGRLSARRMTAYRRWSSLYRPLLAALERCGVQTEDDAARFVELGARPEALVVTGNVKYDLRPPEVDVAAVRARLGLGPGRAVLVAGSTARGEEELVLEAYAETRREFADLLLVLAPRHLERTRAVAQLVAARGLRARALSQEPGEAGPHEVVLVDTLGELAALYRVASAAFVGGSLVPVGGHNVLEPAAVGVPVLFGPYTTSVDEPARALVAAGAARRVADAAELAAALAAILGDGTRRAAMGRSGVALVAANRGALGRSAELLLGVLER